MKKIAVFTSGGDSPGMNAAIRAVVRTAIYHNMQVAGIMKGYEGMINGEFIQLQAASVANIIQRGGTILKSYRSKKFVTEEGMKAAYEQLKKHKIEGVVAIGGDGTFKGADEFMSKYSIPFIGIPGTIDNDLVGTDFTLGYDTAINTVIEAVDKIRDTAESHNRIFFVEVMGRDAGLIALRSGIGAGAEAIIIPETPTNVEQLISKLSEGRADKSSKIVLVAEGDEEGGAFKLADKVKEKLNSYSIRVTILGHIQRGGAPTCMERVLASRLGLAAVEALKDGRKGEMVGVVNGKITYTPFKNAVKHITTLNPELVKLIEILSL